MDQLARHGGQNPFVLLALSAKCISNGLIQQGHRWHIHVTVVRGLPSFFLSVVAWGALCLTQTLIDDVRGKTKVLHDKHYHNNINNIPTKRMKDRRFRLKELRHSESVSPKMYCYLYHRSTRPLLPRPSSWRSSHEFATQQHVWHCCSVCFPLAISTYGLCPIHR